MPICEIEGDRGSIIFSVNGRKAQSHGRTADFSDDPTRQQTGYEEGWEPVPLEPVNPFEGQLRNFITAIIAGRPCKPDWEDAVATHRLIQAAYESADTGRAVTFGGGGIG